jgi:hypothetical protein
MNIISMYNYNFFEDNNSKLISDLNKFLPKAEKKWVYTDYCQSCNTPFGNFLNRQHHCRSCGRSFCWECCHNSIDVPIDIISSPKEDESYKKKITNFVGNYILSNIYNSRKKIVCNNCHSKILVLNKIKIDIYVFEYCDILTLFKLMKVSKNFYNASIYWLFKFKSIQNNINSVFNEWELNMLNLNMKYFNEHSLWIKKSIKGYLYEKYIHNGNDKSEIRINFDNIYKNLINGKNIDCANIFCSLKCRHSLTIYDIIEIIEIIIYYENTFEKIFWKDNSLILNIKLLIKKTAQPNNLTIKNVIPIFIRLLSKLLDTNFALIDLDFIFDLYDFILLDTKKICFILSEIEIMKNVVCENGRRNFILLLEKYVEERKIDINDDLIKIKKLRDFSVNIYYNNNLSYIKSLLPIPYFFDFDMEIIDVINIKKYSNKNEDILLYLKMRYLSNLREKEGLIMIKKVENFDEYYINNITKIIYEKIYSYAIKLQYMIQEFPLCEMKILSPSFLAIEIPVDSNLVNEMSEKNTNIIESLFHNNCEKNTEKIRKNFCYSLSFFSVIIYIFNLEVKDDMNFYINMKGQICTVNYAKNKIKKNTILIQKKFVKGFENIEYISKKTIEFLNIIYLHQDIINSYLNLVNGVFIKEEKHITDIKFI